MNEIGGVSSTYLLTALWDLVLRLGQQRGTEDALIMLQGLGHCGIGVLHLAVKVHLGV